MTPTAILPSPPPPPNPLDFSITRLSAVAEIDAGGGVYVPGFTLPGHLWAVTVSLPPPNTPDDQVWTDEVWMLADPVPTKAQAALRLKVLRDGNQDWRTLRRTRLLPLGGP